jgi:hypothetical protein
VRSLRSPHVLVMIRCTVMARPAAATVLPHLLLANVDSRSLFQFYYLTSDGCDRYRSVPAPVPVPVPLPVDLALRSAPVLEYNMQIPIYHGTMEHGTGAGTTVPLVE